MELVIFIINIKDPLVYIKSFYCKIVTSSKKFVKKCSLWTFTKRNKQLKLKKEEEEIEEETMLVSNYKPISIVMKKY